jgi:PKD repeat protein
MLLADPPSGKPRAPSRRRLHWSANGYGQPGDGGTSPEPDPAHTYTSPGTYTWTLTVTSGGENLTRTGTVDVCSLSCSATVAGPGQTGAAAPFLAAAYVSGGCSDPASYAWTFGDGATSSDQNPSNTYTSAGTYTWTLTVTAGGATCALTGTVTIVDPPVISTMTKLTPFAIKVTGSYFQPGIQVFIGTSPTPWSSVTSKNTTTIVIPGGPSLKNLFPKGQPVAITLVNPDGGFAT